MIIGHFFQSISTFNRYKNLKKSDDVHMSVHLPKQGNSINKKTLIFDMDETLIHAEPFNK